MIDPVMERLQRMAALQGRPTGIPPVTPPVVDHTVPQMPIDMPTDSMTLKRIADRGGDYNTHVDIRRVCDLPVVMPMTPDEHDFFNQEYLLSHAYYDGFRLFDVQAESVNAFRELGGLFAPIGVGWGKTLICWMASNIAFTEQGRQKILHLVPPRLVHQLVTRDIRFARGHVPINFPIHVVAGLGPKARRGLCQSGKKGSYIFPYSLLSQKDMHELIEMIDPDLIICDEAHMLANKGSARTRRLLKYISHRQPAGVCLSGTITSKSIKEYHHLIQWCLGSFSPLPQSVGMAEEWASVIDADATKESENVTTASAPMAPLVDWARRMFPAEEFKIDVPGFRKAYKMRLNYSKGVVCSGDSEIGTSLMINNEKVIEYDQCEGWQELEGLMSMVADDYITPNGDEIEHAIHTWKWLYELSAGFYNELTWPTPEVLSDRRRIDPAAAEDVIERSQYHHNLGQVYAKLLKDWLPTAPQGVDTPLTAGQYMAQHGTECTNTIPPQVYQAWLEWKHADFEGRIDRDGRAVRVCPFKVDPAVDQAMGWQEHGQGGLIWVHHKEMGRWIHEALAQKGVYSELGPSDEIVENEIYNNRVMILSLSRYSDGKNLQHFQNQRVVQWPRQAKKAEQFLGRCHRNGQKADELTVTTSNTLEFDYMTFAACLNDALYIHQTTGVRQKLIYSDYEPAPKIFPASVLRQRGLENKILTFEQQKLLTDKFGD